MGGRARARTAETRPVRHVRLADGPQRAGRRAQHLLLHGGRHLRSRRPTHPGGADGGSTSAATRSGCIPATRAFAPEVVAARARRRCSTPASARGVEQAQWGGRQHYLRWENPETWRACEDAGLAHDSTLGFSAGSGFRTGACVDHPVFDLRARRALRLRERPLVVMDGGSRPRRPATTTSPEAVIARLRERAGAWAATSRAVAQQQPALARATATSTAGGGRMSAPRVASSWPSSTRPAFIEQTARDCRAGLRRRAGGPVPRRRLDGRDRRATCEALADETHASG